MKWNAAKTSAGLCLLFLVVYNGCNYLTSLRSGVPTYFWAWERHIPFVPIFIVPYMSIDLFFVAAPFFCRDEIALRTLSRRIVAAILIAGVCFLLFPLRFAFARPYVAGPLGLIFNNFRNIDKPFNQCPSLHMALRTILAVFYVRRFSGVAKWPLRIWFSMIGFSTVLTYQHHVIDVIGGLALGVLCIHLFGDEPLRTAANRNGRVGAYYFSGAIGLIALAAILRGWALVLIWPGISLALLCSAYFWFGPGIYRKSCGQISLTARVLLWPVILGQRISLVYYARRSEAWNALTPNIWIGRRLNQREAEGAIARGVNAVLDLTCEFSESPAFRAVRYRQLAILDLTAPTAAQVAEAMDFFQEQSEGIAYVHCKAGYSRTAVIAGAYLLVTGRAASAEEAVGQLRAIRPGIIIRPEALGAIRMFAEQLNCSAIAQNHPMIMAEILNDA
jgi:membrane-associated phospholipid phosphatase